MLHDVTVIIPARMGSTRLFGKPLMEVHGVPMISRVHDLCLRVMKPSKVYVATPDEKIYAYLSDTGRNVILTKDTHESGTDRILEAVNKISIPAEDKIVNVQGDMPYFDTNIIRSSAEIIRGHHLQMGTVCLVRDCTQEEIDDENVVKCQFSFRDDTHFIYTATDFYRKSELFMTPKYAPHKHVGIYSFSQAGLEKFASLPRSKREIERSLEQMRALDNNMTIGVTLTDRPVQSVDTLEDLVRINRLDNYGI